MPLFFVPSMMNSRLFMLLFGVSLSALAVPCADARPTNGTELAHLEQSEPWIHIEMPQKTIVPPTHKAAKGTASPFRKSDKSVPDKDFPQWRQNLTVDNISKLSHLNEFYMKAALRMQNKLKQRNLQILDYYFVDVNDDETFEIAALSQSRDESARIIQHLSIYDFDDEITPMLRYERSQTAKDNAQTHQYTQHISALEQGMSLCEDWQIASWNIHECHDILFDENWSPQVLKNTIQTSEPKAHSSQSNTFDFQSRLASRTYERLPDGPYMPPLKRSASYAMLFAGRDETLPPMPQTLETNMNAGFADSSGHEPIGYGLAWNAHGLYISLELQDSDLTPAKACSDQLSVQLVDHVELWFDLNPALEIKRDAPLSWQLEYEKNYQNEPYRHSIDDDVYGLAVTSDGCVVPMTPSRHHWHEMPKIEVTPGKNGYHVDVFIPAPFYHTQNMKQFKRALGIGFTARQHDIHESGYDSVATSQYQWPDPFTFGQIWLLPGGMYQTPTFPLQWSTWLIDN